MRSLTFNLILLLHIFIVPSIAEGGGGRFRFLSSVFKNIIQHKIFRRKSSSTATAQVASNAEESIKDYLNFVIDENTILRNDVINYKKIINSQKRSYQTTKSELLHLQIKIDNIEETHKKEIEQLKHELLSQFHQEKQLYESSLIEDYKNKTNQFIQEFNHTKSIEIHTIKQELLNQIQIIQEKEMKEKEQLKLLLKEEKENAKDLKYTFDENIQLLQQQHKQAIEDIKKSLKSVTSSSSSPTAAAAAVKPTTTATTTTAAAIPVTMTAATNQPQQKEEKEKNPQKINSAGTSSGTSAGSSSSSSSSKPKKSKLTRRIPSSSSNNSNSSGSSSSSSGNLSKRNK